MNKFIGGLAFSMLIGMTLGACAPKESTDVKEEVAPVKDLVDANKDYLSAVDVDYAFEFTKSLEEFKTNEKLGYRTAGSVAELKTGEKIAEEMKEIGLTEVTKDEFTLDTWEFEKADLTFVDENGEEHLAVLGAYQVNFDTNGVKELEIVYGGKGTANDLANLDVEGKLVLIDINQREEWWINYPAYQAHLKGAAAVIAVQEAGYAETDEDALNAQDICGPDDAPAFSMSQTDANQLKKALESSENGTMTVKFDAKSIVKMDGKSYNYYGKIIGKDPDSYIILSAHYDSYFTGFQDDHAAIGLMMGVAKGLVDSGYQPEKTIIFNALAAEEWGVSNSRYDWSTGAYNQIFNIHPEWVGKAFANMNFELPAYEHTTQDEIRSVYELNNYLTKFAKTVPSVDGVYKDGISVVSPLRTWSDDFSFGIAGVPALRNDFQDSDFMRTHYHSQFDNEDTYNADALKFHLNLYGLLSMHYDETAVVPLDFTTRLTEMKKVIDADIFGQAEVSSDQLVAEIDKAIALAEEVNTKVLKVNDNYLTALTEEDTDKAQKLYEDSRELNSGLLSAFKYAEDQFVRLTWEDDQIFPHEHAQNNITNLTLAIDALNKGDITTAIDEYLWAIDNNWYAYDFEKEVFDYFTNYVLDAPKEKLMWGDGRIVGHENLFNPINALIEKSGQEDADISAELASLNEALERQKALLQKTTAEEIIAVQELAKKLEALK
ncbi:M28 family peptidase [Psychrobacillus psychrodurans]|uniref:M28 family peptidase n=1 Tax=Psychrobacillus psychrodurans TaxID=126157 RepID=UPI0008EA9A2F|nr:M28 family peptidase [Psychrobacillus psychrodurans]MCZ8541314.1 M28 family metallopeptidase [Psychrobacillus psychrodurans]SFM96066.1 PA domain-containing protein [Psychrobacillus psychrodurans]